MTNWIWAISNVMSRFDQWQDGIKQWVAKKIGTEDPICIMPYRGWGTSEWLYLKGRVLEDQGIKLREENASVWKNLRNMYRRFESDEVPNVTVRAMFADVKQDVVTDAEGYFEVEISCKPSEKSFEGDSLAQGASSDKLWQKLDLELVNPSPDAAQTEMECIKAQGEVIVVSDRAKFGVISDIDDTIMPTAATDVFKMIRLAYLGNERSRRPFAGVPAFYQALQQGQGNEGNPIFYVSSSAWNMYDLFVKFMDFNGMPAGPILLRDVELSPANWLSFDHQSHKLEQIGPIFERFPQLHWILIGDTGQKDAEIYSHIVQQYPDKILGVYLHDVTPTQSQRRQQLEAIAQTVQQNDSEWVIFSDTVTAATHAAQQGWIAQSTLSEIASNTAKER